MFKFLFLVSLSSVAYSQGTQPAKPAEKAKPDVHRTEHVNTTTININDNVRPDEKTQTEEFCGTSKADCKKQCQDWLKEQKKTLKSALRTSHCSGGIDLYGKENKEGCMNVACSGKITYVLKN